MITEQHQNETFSTAFLTALACRAGCKVQFQPGTFDYGIDVEFKEVTSVPIGKTGKNGLPLHRFRDTGVSFAAQVKCTKNLTPLRDKPGTYSYSLDADNYNDLVDSGSPGSIPKILIVVLVPEKVEDWMTLGGDDLVLRRTSFYLNLMGESPTPNDYQRVVHIPDLNRFTPAKIVDFFDCQRKLRRLE